MGPENEKNNKPKWHYQPASRGGISFKHGEIIFIKMKGYKGNHARVGAVTDRGGVALTTAVDKKTFKAWFPIKALLLSGTVNHPRYGDTLCVVVEDWLTLKSSQRTLLGGPYIAD